MDIYTYLKKDHRTVSRLMNEVLETDNIREREELLEEIRHELTLHAETEQATFYAALENKKLTEEKIEDAEDDHKEVKKYLKKLSSMDADSDEWLILFGEFKHAVEHHVKDEETRIFEKARQILDEEDATELAEEMDSMKRKSIKKAA